MNLSLWPNKQDKCFTSKIHAIQDIFVVLHGRSSHLNDAQHGSTLDILRHQVFPQQCLL